MNQTSSPTTTEQYRHILGVRFFVGDAPQAVEIGQRGGLVVVPSAPSLMEITRNRAYRQAILEADLAITDSGFMVLLWNLIMQDKIQRVSGLEYLHLLLESPECRKPGSVFWVMPSAESWKRNVAWLEDRKYPVAPDDAYISPMYGQDAIHDEPLLELLKQRKPHHVIICLGGGVQERLGLSIARNCDWKPAIHCIGAAIGFLNGDQVGIPLWADKLVLGWFFRCVSNPRRFVPRYVRALALAPVLWHYRSRLPGLKQA